jgi:hypothetical protein
VQNHLSDRVGVGGFPPASFGDSPRRGTGLIRCHLLKLPLMWGVRAAVEEGPSDLT